MIRILVEFGTFTWDIFGNLSTLGWKSRPMNQMTIYCVILQALTALFLLKTLQCFLRDAPFLSAEPLRPRNGVSKIRHLGQTSELLWNLLPLHLITAWQRRSNRWREAGNGSVMPFTRWEFPRYKFQVSGFQDFFFAVIPNIQILEFLVPYMKHFPNILSDFFAQKHYVKPAFLQKHLGNNFLDDNELIHLERKILLPNS